MAESSIKNENPSAAAAMPSAAVRKIQNFDRFGGGVLGLERIERLMEMLGNPQDGLKFIHVAGTNGKGSVCRYIYEVLEANGYKAGLYTSPFIGIFNERIEFDRCLISDEELDSYSKTVFEKADEMKNAGFEAPTEFEIITAVAFLYFADKKADFVVLEVGLGGRLDATNVIKKPLVSVITSISFDHTERLGNTLALIAGEKAGIIKSGVPVVSNVPQHEAAAVIARKAYEYGCVLHDCSKTKYWNMQELGEWTENADAENGYDFLLKAQSFDTNIELQEFGSLEISMLGEHQIKNAITALTVLEVLRKSHAITLEKAKLYGGMKNAVQTGRFEIVKAESGKPVRIIDGAHNEDGAKALAEAVKKHFSGKRILMLTGVLADKDVDAILDSLCELADDFIVTQPKSPRALDAAQYAERIKKRGKNVLALAKEPKEAAEKAVTKAETGGYDILLAAGSLYLVGEIGEVFRHNFDRSFTL